MTSWLTPETAVLLLTFGGCFAVLGIASGELSTMISGGCMILAGWIAGMVRDEEDADDPR